VEYIRILEHLRPKTLVLENVPGMTTGKMRPIFNVLMSEIKRCGYQMQAWVMDAAWFGVPQHRKRLICLGVRDDVKMKLKAPKLTHYHKGVSVLEALGKPLATQCDQFTKYGVYRQQKYQKQWRSCNLPSYTLCASCFPQVRLCVPNDPLPPIFSKDEKARTMSLEEGRKIQSFPDWLRADTMRMIGNAVPSLMTQRLAEHLLTYIKGSEDA
jgi:DNA (cytosine-5)-methyltransferase 1